MKIGKISACGKLTSYGKWYPNDTLYQTNRLYYVHSGLARYSELGEERYIESGMIYLIPATESFAPIAVGDEPFVHSYADFVMISPIKCVGTLSVAIDTDEELRLATEILLLGCDKKEELRSGGTKCSDSFFSLFEHAISYIVTRIAEKSGADFVSDSVVTRAISIMNRRMNENISVRDIAEAVYMSEDGFIRRFSRIMGKTPYSYLKKLRLMTAESMITDGVSISDVALAVGYSDTSSLLHALSSARKKNDI